MSDINDRLNGDDIEISRRDVKERVTDIIYTDSEATDGDVLQYNSTTGMFNSVTPNAAGLYLEGGTDLPITDGGTGASTAADARTNLGLGTIATQNANAVNITGGTITGITDLAVADGGTGASTHTSGNILLGNGTSSWTSTSGLTVSQGGSGVTSNTAYMVLCGGTTSTAAIQSIASLGSATQWLTSNGASSLPTFQNALTDNIDGRLQYLSSQTASNSASIDFTGLSSTYLAYVVCGVNIVPGSHNTYLVARYGTGSTPTYVASAGTYYVDGCDASGSKFGRNGSDSYAWLTYTVGLGVNTGQACNFKFTMFNPSGTSVYKTAVYEDSYYSYVPSLSCARAMAGFSTTSAITALRFMMSSGNIASGTFHLYGLKS